MGQLDLLGEGHIPVAAKVCGSGIAENGRLRAIALAGRSKPWSQGCDLPLSADGEVRIKKLTGKELSVLKVFAYQNLLGRVRNNPIRAPDG